LSRTVLQPSTCNEPADIATERPPPDRNFAPQYDDGAALRDGAESV
jgi:hypothetical protein